jgi:uncharacterized RDD family membrane protein YckC
MTVTASRPPRHGFSLSLWPSLLFGFLAIKAVLSLVLELGDKLAPYGTSIYFLLLLLATGFAFRNAAERTQGRRVHRGRLWTMGARPMGLCVLRGFAAR